MTPITSRLFLYCDEWPWIFLSLALLYTWARCKAATLPIADRPVFYELVARCAFLVVLIVGAILIYVIGYPMHWRLSGEFP